MDPRAGIAQKSYGKDRRDYGVDADQRYQEKCSDEFLQPYGHIAIQLSVRAIPAKCETVLRPELRKNKDAVLILSKRKTRSGS